MALLPILLGVRRATVRGKGGDLTVPPVAHTKDRTAILKRDGFTCQYCGFKSAKHQTVRWHEGNKSSASKDGFVTACLFCDQCFSLETAGVSGSGIVIWLPEMSQAELNHVCRAAYLARATSEQYAEPAQQALDSLSVGQYAARQRLGTSDPMILATVLSDVLSDDEYADRAKRLDGLRLMPTDRRLTRRHGKEIDVFPEMLAFWQASNGPFGKIQPKSWEKLLNKLNGAQAKSA